MSTSAPFFAIQAMLYAFSGLLLMGSAIAHFTKARYAMESGGLIFSSENTDERRRAPRIRDHSILQLAADLETSGAQAGRLLNLSSTGACFVCAQALKKGERFLGMLFLSHANPQGITARVVWSKREGDRTLYGIQFDSPIQLIP